MKLKQKIITVFTTIILLGGYILPIGQLAIASGVENLENQTAKTQSANVEFNTYLEGSVHEKEYNLLEGGKMYVKLEVKENGYLKNGIVEFSDCNYNLNSNQINSENIQKIENNSIYLAQINSGENIEIEVPVNFEKQESINLEQFDKLSKAKLIGTYISGNGKEIPIEKEITNKIKWVAEAEAQVNAKINKYIPYNIEEEYGVLVQAKVNAEINQNVLPIASTNLRISVPSINEQIPEEVKVIANKTIATNGEETGLNFTSQNYAYNKEENEVTINVENPINAQGNIAWQNGQDEYLISYIYKGQEIYNYVTEELRKAEETKKTQEQLEAGEQNENAINMPVQVNGTITTYGTEQKQIQIDLSTENIIQEAKGSLADFEVQTEKSLSKGYIYANYAKAEKEAKKENIEPKQQTMYEQTYKANIYNPEIITEVKFTTNEEKLVEENKEMPNNEYPVGTNIITKKVKISENVFQKILGEQGILEILDKNQNTLGKINSSSEKDEQGNYVINIEGKNVNEITIKTSAPVSEGTLEIKVEKAFSQNQSFSQEQMKNFTKVIVTSNLETNTNSKNYSEEIQLQEPISKAEIKVEEENKNLTTVAVNKDVDLSVVLDTSSIQNALYKNPVIKIEMPKQVKKVDLKSANLLLDDELEIVDKKVTKENGKQVINLKIKGTQTQYQNYENTEANNVITKGANILLKTDITLDTLASNSVETINMYYTNENTEHYENENRQNSEKIYGLATTSVNISAPTGVIAANSITGYSENGSQIMNIDQEKLEANVTTYTNERQVTFEGIVTNNYTNNIEDVVILGRLPFTGNKKIDTTEDLGSNFNMSLKEAIEVTGIDTSKVKVYYSTSEEATKESVGVEESTWKETVENYANIKSYLIVITGEIANSAQIHFKYQANLPGNLSYNKSSYTTYKVYYNNKISEDKIAETKTAGIVGVTTGYGPNVEISVSSNLNEVKEGQIIKLTATAKNTGDVEIQNAKFKITAPEGTKHTEIKSSYYYDSEETEKTIEIGSIKPGETITKTYELKVIKEYTMKQELIPNTDDVYKSTGEYEYKGDKTIQNVVRLTADNIQNEAKSEPFEITVKEGNISIVNIASKSEDTILKKGDNIEYKITLRDITYENNAENVTLNVEIPQGIIINNMSYKNGNEEIPLSSDSAVSNKISLNIEKIDKVYGYTLIVKCKIDSFIGKLSPVAKATINNEEYSANVISHTVEKVQLSIKQEDLENKYIKENKEYSYFFTIENIGKITSYNNIMKLSIPEELSLQYVKNGTTKTNENSSNPNIVVTIYELKPGEKETIEVAVKGKMITDGEDKEVTTKATLEAAGFETIESNSIKVTIEYVEPTIADPSGTQTQPGTKYYKISGTAWLDENKDGKRDETEKLLAGIPVVLVYKNNNSIVKDTNTNTNKQVTTNNDGEYEFTNVPNGEYLVVFLYDASSYNVTAYKAQNVAETVNSDATNVEITLEGTKKIAGVTDLVKIADSNVRDIDIGLYVSEKFDLKLDKYISKITLTTPTIGTKVYNYNNDQLAKIEVLSKNVNKSSIIVEYRIVVTNEGKVPGYAKKIVDYLPSSARFNTEINKDWYYSENKQNLYNTSLAETVIKPGESKEVKLILSYNITDKTVGNIVTNEAEIYESYNEQGLIDMDSTEANKLSNEDDISQAEIILSVSTGSVVIYATLTFAVITILIIGIYIINQKVLKRREE